MAFPESENQFPQDVACPPRPHNAGYLNALRPDEARPVQPHAHDEHHLHSHAGEQAYGRSGD